MHLKNKHIVITGGTSGLGRELVRQLADCNQLIVIARPSAALDQLRSDYPDIAIFEADLANQTQVVAAAEAIGQRYEVLDGLINNAAIQYTPEFRDDDFKFDSIASEIAVNLTTPCQICALLLPNLARAEEAFILNVNSGLGLVPKTSSAIYCATKGGLNIFSQSLANQLEGTGVRVAQAFLPLVDTAMTRGRGNGKLPADMVARTIIHGLARKRPEINVGKVKLLRPIARFLPSLARKIMKSN